MVSHACPIPLSHLVSAVNSAASSLAQHNLSEPLDPFEKSRNLNERSLLRLLGQQEGASFLFGHWKSSPKVAQIRCKSGGPGARRRGRESWRVP